MAGKAPLLLASVLFAIGAVGLALTSAERAEWGPFEPHSQGQREPSHIVVFNVERTLHDAPDLRGLAPPPPVVMEVERQAVVAAVQPESAAPTAAPNPPLVVHGISADDSVSAAAATPTPPPLRIINVANDDEPAPEETPAPEPTSTPAEG